MRLLPLLFCLPLFAACQKDDDSRTDPVAERVAGREVEVEQADHRVTIRAKDAQLQIARDGTALPLPADFPADVFVPDGFVVRNSVTVPRMLNVSGTAPGTAAGLFDQARGAMQRQGWEEKLVTQRPAMQMLSLEKGDRETVINVMEAKGVVQLSYSVRTRR